MELIKESLTNDNKKESGQSESESGIFEVIRGTKMQEVSAVARWWILLHNKTTAGNEKEIGVLTKKIKEVKGNYGGVFFSNFFKVDRSINLIGLGFLGPFNDGKANYIVIIDIYEPKSSKDMLTSSCSKRIIKYAQNITVSGSDEDINAKFQEPVPIQARKWYLIQFMLEGPDTWRCERILQSTKVSVGDSNVNFDFDIGSKQMRSMKFTLH